jgi:outer membrane protein insertion porin family
LSYEYRTNGRHCDDRFNPTDGVDVHGKIEVAGPPGNVGFVKMQGGASFNVPLPWTWALHGSVQAGMLRSLPLHGLCGPASISDRFFVGGPMQLRGFVPAGIGPRAKTVSKVWLFRLFLEICQLWYFLTRLCVFLARVFVPKGGASCPGGDTLGGDLFYTATLAASVPFPAVAFLRDNGVRCFGFANVGTVSGGGLDDAGVVGVVVPFLSILQSTRASVGGGVSMATAFGRLEATYATPLRYSPRDARKSVQIGLGFSFG